MIINDNVATHIFFHIVCTSKLWDNNIVSKIRWNNFSDIKAHLLMQ